MKLFKKLKGEIEIRQDNNDLCLTCKRDSRENLSELQKCTDNRRKYKYVKIPKPSYYNGKLQCGTTLIITYCPHYIKKQD